MSTPLAVRAEWAQWRAETRAAIVAGLAAAGNAIVLVVTDGAGERFTIHPSTRQPPDDGWQLTWWSPDGAVPHGHAIFTSRDEALVSACGGHTSHGQPHGTRQCRVIEARAALG